MEREIWRDIKSFEGAYQVSDRGRVKSLHRVIIGKRGRPLTVNERILKQNTDRAGYRYVSLQKNGQPSYKKVHRLVGEAFLKNDDNLPQINHKNGRKEDNRLENLEWVTAEENQSHRYHVLKKQKDVHHKPRGVNWRENRGKWRARIKVNGQEKMIGHFSSKKEAYRAYYEKYTELHGYEPWSLDEFPTHERVRE